MQLKSAIEQFKGLRYMIDNLNIQSGIARRYLYNSEFMTNAVEIENGLNKISQTLHLTRNIENEVVISEIKQKLSQIRDIRGTIKNIQHKMVLDDVQLFEIKYFGLLCMDIKHCIRQLNITYINLPELDSIVAILDPEQQLLPTFYIYNAYSEELADLRIHLKEAQNKFKNTAAPNDTLSQNVENLYQKSVIIEDSIRKNLSDKLLHHNKDLENALQAVAELDILIAKAEQAVRMGLCQPRIVQETSSYKALFYPRLKERLEEESKVYQAVDITLDKSPCLITGANMTGKTVLLKSIALAQALMQFGFFVPAAQADIAIVEQILICMEDKQSELSGLSSFAAEMININSIIEHVHNQKNVLVLIDELARTTNPYEGRAIVRAMLDILQEHHTRSLITTHYGITTSCRKLRVKGFIQEKIKDTLTIHNMHDFIDYSLVEETENEAPMEALRVASALGVDKSLIEKAKEFISKE